MYIILSSFPVIILSTLLNSMICFLTYCWVVKSEFIHYPLQWKLQEGNVFTGVCLSTGGLGYPWYQVLSGGEGKCGGVESRVSGG